MFKVMLRMLASVLLECYLHLNWIR